METETYKINKSTLPWNAKCICTHTLAAHGSNGLICCACKCKKFVEAFDNREPVTSKDIKA